MHTTAPAPDIRTVLRPKVALAAARAPFLSASVATGLLAVVWAWYSMPGSFSWPHGIAALVGLALVHLAANTMNDHADWDGSDAVNRFAGPFSGGSRHRLEGLLSRWHFGVLTVVFGGAATLTGLLLALAGRPLVLALGFAGGLLALAYSAPPLKLMARGLGELTVFALFGPMTTWGVVYAATGRLSPAAALLGLSPGALVAAILWINEFPDAEADRTTGKKTLVVRLGTRRAVWGLAGLFAFHVAALVYVAVAGIAPMEILAGLAPLPLAVRALVGAWKRHDDPVNILPFQRDVILHQALSTVAMAGGIALSALH